MKYPPTSQPATKCSRNVTMLALLEKIVALIMPIFTGIFIFHILNWVCIQAIHFLLAGINNSPTQQNPPAPSDYIYCRII